MYFCINIIFTHNIKSLNCKFMTTLILREGEAAIMKSLELYVTSKRIGNQQNRNSSKVVLRNWFIQAPFNLPAR